MKRLYITTNDLKFHCYSEYKLEIRGSWAIVTDFEGGMHYFPAVNIIKIQEKTTDKALGEMPGC